MSTIGNQSLPFDPSRSSGKPRDAQRFNGDGATYEGMSQETIVTMLAEQGLTAEFIDEETYNAELKILQARLKNRD